jgi:hypothetical protein
MHDEEVFRRPEGLDSETVEEEELTLGKRHVGSMRVVRRENPVGRAQ